MREIYFAGVLSLVIIMMSGLFVGMVLSLQGYETLKRYGSDEQLGILVALALVRELGPVIAGLLFASRAGSAITAEIGLMKTTEQLSAMEMMAVDPIARVVAPRFWGGVISMPLLAALFSAAGVFGGYIVAVPLIGIDEGAFWGQMKAGVDVWPDVTNGIIKSVVFGVAVSLIAVFEGYDSKPTAEGVSTATTRTVVISSLAILALDFVMTTFMFRGRAREPFRHRPLGRHLRRDRARRGGVPRLQGREPGDARPRARLPARGTVRQYRRAQDSGPGQGRGGGRRTRRAVRLDPKTYEAVATLRIDRNYEFTKDTIASINTSGLLGEVYIGLDAGGDPVLLKDGDRIAKTQSAVVLEKLIGQFLFDRAAADPRGGGAADGAGAGRREQEMSRRVCPGQVLLLAVASAMLAGCAAADERGSSRTVQPHDVRR